MNFYISGLFYVLIILPKGLTLKGLQLTKRYATHPTARKSSVLEYLCNIRFNGDGTYITSYWRDIFIRRQAPT